MPAGLPSGQEQVTADPPVPPDSAQKSLQMCLPLGDNQTRSHGDTATKHQPQASGSRHLPVLGSDPASLAPPSCLPPPQFGDHFLCVGGALGPRRSEQTHPSSKRSASSRADRRMMCALRGRTLPWPQILSW